MDPWGNPWRCIVCGMRTVSRDFYNYAVVDGELVDQFHCSGCISWAQRLVSTARLRHLRRVGAA